MNLLIPLWVALALLGWGDRGPQDGNPGAPSSLGLTPAQIADVYVDYAEAPPVASGRRELVGLACRTAWADQVAAEFRLACRALPDRTVVLFTQTWPIAPAVEAYLLRHEVEHLLRGPDGPADDPWNEAAATAAGCAVAVVSICP